MKNYLQYFISFLFVLMIYAIHMLPVSDSMLNENNTKLSHVFLASQIRYHQEFAPFARRPLTSLLIEGSSGIFGVTLGESFVLVNLLLLFVSGILIYIISIKLNATKGQALFNQVAYFLTFSILFAFFPPVFSYDEPLQYCLIMLSVLALIQQKWRHYVPLFLMATIARESTVFLWPGLVIIFSGLSLKSKNMWSPTVRKKLFLLFLPLPLYGIYLGIFLWATGIWKETSEVVANRLSCYFENFGTYSSSVETIVSFFLVLGPSLYFLYMSMKPKAFTLLEKKYVLAFLVALVINSPIVMAATLARETRLFALPLFFIWPLVGQLFGKDLTLLSRPGLYLDCFKNWRYRILLLALCLINYMVSFKLYVPSFPAKDNFFNEYLFVLLLMISLHFVLVTFKDKNRGTVG
ncbi:hypothetical protein H4O18_16100 [Arenibacter sp. BSSL-BM3]|uniref:DUF2029 domain-containing protein n=1 Tax=Arenibacter arenosicollis TaxID=2762274 RepID=A0ABR7QQN8_9FLAO|nr:hypothetical protein [Arenibacter arenosicollis]MBC8769521.1 hypothetical protein [Arenibacter arenosicollis]